ncbi:hypothetical protein pVco7_gp021 [Vibrio phage pVco-7]|uniref:Uncharacterized protein n=1 Tax=Vibrio phage pVco-5 TaxID=1965485 RepID=A0A1W6JUS7_9CAUD|nr:hypothetical protein KNT61_gp022 [Vibrio phage pVco-5]ARM71010.1 hypothetical protein pVco5_022 [Vibrio phage pVco-5]
MKLIKTNVHTDTAREYRPVRLCKYSLYTNTYVTWTKHTRVEVIYEAN